MLSPATPSCQGIKHLHDARIAIKECIVNVIIKSSLDSINHSPYCKVGHTGSLDDALTARFLDAFLNMVRILCQAANLPFLALLLLCFWVIILRRSAHDLAACIHDFIDYQRFERIGGIETSQLGSVSCESLNEEEQRNVVRYQKGKVTEDTV